MSVEYRRHAAWWCGRNGKEVVGDKASERPLSPPPALCPQKNPVLRPVEGYSEPEASSNSTATSRARRRPGEKRLPRGDVQSASEPEASECGR